MKKLEEIKRGLECDDCKSCPWRGGEDDCLWSDDFALAYIRLLEAENAALKKALSFADVDCSYCRYALENNPYCELVDGDCGNCAHRKTCPCTTCTRNNCHWEWCGLPDDAGGVK